MTEVNVPGNGPSPAIDRRGLFRIGGLTAATALAVAACGKTEAGELGNIGGNGGTQPVLPDAIVNDGVLLRTMAGIETSIANAYGRMKDLGDQADLVALFAEQHVKAAESFNQLAQEAGEEAWTCGNSRLDDAFLTPIFDRIENGVDAIGTAKAIPPSDDATRDYLNLVLTLESLSAESCQALVPTVSEPAFRFTAMQLGARSSRQAALIALRINPGGYVVVGESAASTDTTVAETTTTVTDEAGPPLTEIPLPVAVPGQFGQLSAITYIGGAGDENGVRLKLNFETPSLNSYAYPFDACK